MIPIIYEDDSFIVFDKPPRLLVIPTAKEEKRTLVNVVNEEYHKLHPERTENLHPCHRLDRDTSGCILFAKGKKAQKLGMELFHQKVIEKVYIAVVHGTIPKKEGTIAKKINYKEASTQYTVLQTKKDFSVVRIKLLTGRTNQIRIHFSEIKHPVVGERKFAFARDFDLKFKRTALHAFQLKFKHPQTQAEVQVVSTIPKDMEVFCDRSTIKGS